MVRKMVFFAVFICSLALFSGNITPLSMADEFELSSAPDGKPPVSAEPDHTREGGLIGNAPAAPSNLRDFRITGTALRPRQDNVSYVPTSSGGCMYASAGDAFTIFNTPLYLPQGSVVNALRMYYNDTSSASNSSAWLTVYDLYGGIVNEWLVDSTGNSGNGYNNSAAIDHTIDYSLYSYALNWRPKVLGSTMQLCGFRIYYTPPPGGGTVMFPIAVPRK